MGAADLEVPKGKAASALARYASLHPTNLAQKAEIIVGASSAYYGPNAFNGVISMTTKNESTHQLIYRNLTLYQREHSQVWQFRYKVANKWLLNSPKTYGF